MQILLTKISAERHSVRVIRKDGSQDQAELNTRSFLRHDFAHYAVEAEVPFPLGYWGSVAAGTPLGGTIESAEIWLAEALAGQVQTLMRIDAGVSEYLAALNSVVPDIASNDLAERIHERIRQLRGHWQGTPYAGEMSIVWPP